MTLAVDLNKLLEGYWDTGLYLAVTPERDRVIGTGRTVDEALEAARKKGCLAPILMRAPSKKMKGSFHT